MVSETSVGFQHTFNRLDGVAHGIKEMNRELRSTREALEQAKAKLDQELDPQTERAMGKFLREHLRAATPREDFALCRKIRGSYPEPVDRGTTARPAGGPMVHQPQFVEPGLFLF
eukprot:XP_011680026.1 PREDICTED: uncharacterized protein LOC105445763 [Strongylocentrotus purpuratus]